MLPAVAMPAWRVRKPMIAAVNGHALGVGLTLTLQCDIRIFAADATYGIVQVRRGVMGDAYVHWTLPRIVGMSVAADLLLTGRSIDGNEAKELGLCSRALAERRGFAGGPRAGPRASRWRGATVGCPLERASVADMAADSRAGGAARDRVPPPSDGRAGRARGGARLSGEASPALAGPP